ncbi:MAG: DUF4430 domain-containing protein [Lachnospiraceae bacterium]|nr:DUF4430 domain-containing protein [Lachnospiraceae bacterium]
MKIKHLITSAVTAVTLVVTAFVLNTAATVSRGVTDDIWKYEIEQAGASDYESYYNSGLIPYAGNGADWFIIYMKQYGITVDYEAYNTALDRYLKSAGSLKATDYERIGLVKACLGYDSNFIIDTINSKTGMGGIMSTIYGLMLAVSNDYVSPDRIIEIADSLVSLQMADGGWNLSGAHSDADVTAMALQALSSVRSYGYEDSIQKGIARLMSLQKDDAGYASYGVNNSESTAQVLMALCALNIDYRTDTRFIKNGHTVLDALMGYRTTEGAFSHTKGGQSNSLATTQALGALVCAENYEKHGTFIYRYGNIQSRPAEDETQPAVKPSSEQTTETVSLPIGEDNTVTTQYEQEVTGQDETTGKETIVDDVIETTHGEQSSAETLTGESISDKHEETETYTTEHITESGGHDGGISGRTIKIIIIFAIAIISAMIIIIMAAFKKINLKRAGITGIICALLILAAALSKFETVSEHYETGKNGDYVSQITIKGYDDVILDTTQIYISDGDTVFDQLLKAVSEDRINIDYTGSRTAGTIYVRSIDGLAEFDHGSMSGWTYYVNGVMPDVSCASYEIHEGDVIEWIYTDGGDYEEVR